MPVIAVDQVEQVDPAGQLTEMLSITFTISGRAGSFTEVVPQTPDPVAAAAAAVGATVDEVNAIYGLAT
jgi:hypothetical protein